MTAFQILKVCGNQLNWQEIEIVRRTFLDDIISNIMHSLRIVYKEYIIIVNSMNSMNSNMHCMNSKNSFNGMNSYSMNNINNMNSTNSTNSMNSMIGMNNL